MNFAGMKTWVLLIAVFGVGALVFFARGHLSGPATSLSPPESSGADKPQRARIYLGPRNSIAVLPFTGGPEQQEQEQAFWSYGFSRELHRLMTRVPGLLVTSSNSSFFFQDPSVPMPVVAERLQVRYLLSGEIRVTDRQVRVRAVLFDGKAKAEEWTQNFEGELDEVFRIQNEILEESIRAVTPLGKSDFPKATVVETEAWINFMKGLFYQGQRTPMALDAAEQAFLAALESEPDYTPAQLSLAEVWLAQSTTGHEQEQRVADARQALNAVLLIEPDSPAALGLLSYIRRVEDWDWQGALDAAEEAVHLSPGDPELMSTASLAMFTLGQFQKAGDLLDASVRQDPLNLGRRLQLGLLQEFSGQYDEALNSYRVLIGLNPEFPGVRAYRARIKLIQDNPESALRESEQETDPFWKRYSQILAFSALGRDDEARSLLDQMIAEDGGRSAFQVAEILSFRGESDQAFEWLLQAYEQKDGGMSEMIGNFFLRGLHGDPRWEDMLSLLGLPSAVTVD